MYVKCLENLILQMEQILKEFVNICHCGFPFNQFLWWLVLLF